MSFTTNVSHMKTSLKSRHTRLIIVDITHILKDSLLPVNVTKIINLLKTDPSPSEKRQTTQVTQLKNFPITYVTQNNPHN
ncbi:hypothetical protein Hamer_G021995 [Homarus americanus]|uniref:Uncharacterized protein n=1 Tax=Homarus americanus TaxID=6706 RepID=A0A8J5MZY6_HOMAM|nr:hypothetical protein Hamer_G021995 [Homarus americanus]